MDGFKLRRLNLYKDDAVHWAETSRGQRKIFEMVFGKPDTGAFWALVIELEDDEGSTLLPVIKSTDQDVNFLLPERNPFSFCVDEEEPIEELPSNTESSSET